MKRAIWLRTFLLGIAFVGGSNATAAAAATNPSAMEVVRVWPAEAPGTSTWTKPEQASDTHVADAGRVVHLINNVTVPTLTVFRPSAGGATGAGMVVLPGGGFGALAWDLEGTEVARWLAERGITAFVLKYRVYEADESKLQDIRKALALTSSAQRFDAFLSVVDARRRIATDDALQAVRVVRSHAAAYGVVPDRIGMMGFSAGAITTMGAALADDAAARPNFVAPIYGALATGMAAPKDGPRLFIAAASDDNTVPVDRSTAIFRAWQDAGLPAELHIYESGGHGFGLGKPNTASIAWTEAFEHWLVSHGFAVARGK